MIEDFSDNHEKFIDYDSELLLKILNKILIKRIINFDIYDFLASSIKKT